MHRQTKAMSSHPPREEPIKQGQPNPTTKGSNSNLEEAIHQPRVESVIPEQAATAKKTEERIKPKPKKKAASTLYIDQQERAKAWVKTQTAPEPTAPVAEPEKPLNPLKRIGREKNAVLRKYLVDLFMIPVKKVARRTSMTEKPPITTTRKSPATITTEMAERKRKVEETRALYTTFNAQNSWFQPGIEGEAIPKLERGNSPDKKVALSTSMTENPPITMSRESPAKAPEMAERTRTFGETTALFATANTQNRWSQLEDEGEARFNLERGNPPAEHGDPFFT
ncbi:hypothetical protein EG328_006192 [Venturia inaequalis]|uniref:Uncharacterized protein n=1 Tax=Venturia inaequalis TaxID=5025 RepID=A0A8H3ZCJ1_VENIN|nr:hypothetical protein EG328_006192 [Venturia inaequalis]KAE9988347.1 hypothetical protein EG327_003376 [Venturia inaequalis]